MRRISIVLACFCVMAAVPALGNTAPAAADGPPELALPFDVPLPFAVPPWVSMTLLGLGMLLFATAGIWFLVAAFREGVGWGLACLFLPLAAPIFLIMHLRETWKPGLLSFLGAVFCMGGMFLGFATLAAHMQEALPEMAAAIEQEQLAQAMTRVVEQRSPVAATKPDSNSLKVGGLLENVYAQYGHPKGRLRSGDGLILTYANFTLISNDGKTVSEIEKLTSFGSPSRGGRAAKKSSPARPRRPRVASQTVRTISNGGKRVDLKSLLVPGKITVVDFYATWCGPCKAMDPIMTGIAKNDSNVVLRKVNIARWGTPVTQQFGIRSIPNVRVYDRKGRPVGSPTSSIGQIRQYIAQAK